MWAFHPAYSPSGGSAHPPAFMRCPQEKWSHVCLDVFGSFFVASATDQKCPLFPCRPTVTDFFTMRQMVHSCCILKRDRLNCRSEVPPVHLLLMWQPQLTYRRLLSADLNLFKRFDWQCPTFSVKRNSSRQRKQVSFVDINPLQLPAVPLYFLPLDVARQQR